MMPFESINSDATPEEAQDWAWRMQVEGYVAARHIELAIRVTRDCANIKDPLKILHRMMLAKKELLEGKLASLGHPDADYKNAVRTAYEKFVPQAEEQFNLCLQAYSDERKAKLANSKSGKRQLSMTNKTLDVLNELSLSDSCIGLTNSNQATLDAVSNFWYDQQMALQSYW